MTTHAIGNRAEAKILATLVSMYGTVLLPFGDGARYDLVVNDNGYLLKIQCKSGRIRNGCVTFNTNSRSKAHNQDYKKDVDFIAVYCADNAKIYLIPVNDLPSCAGSLRLVPTRSGRSAGILWAADYEI